MAILPPLLDLLFPPKCVFCDRLLEAPGSPVCPTCARDLPAVEPDKPLLRAGGFDCAAAFYYEDMVKTAVHALKFQNRPGRAAVLGRYIAQAAAERLPGRFDAVTFVPVSPVRRFQRGYDQSQLLARAAAEAWGLQPLSLLRKVRHTRPQSTLRAPEERRANALGAYAPVRPAAGAGRRLLLVDDVCTTGSTLSACAETLLAAGAADVVCAVLAVARPQVGSAPGGGI